MPWSLTRRSNFFVCDASSGMGRSSAGGDLLFSSTRKSLSTPVLVLKSSFSRFENLSGSKYNESFVGV